MVSEERDDVTILKNFAMEFTAHYLQIHRLIKNKNIESVSQGV
jgi:hypothetical protein